MLSQWRWEGRPGPAPPDAGPPAAPAPSRPPDWSPPAALPSAQAPLPKPAPATAAPPERAPAPAQTEPPANPSLRRILYEAIRDTGQTIRLITIMAFASPGIAAIVEAARGVHLHLLGYTVPAPAIAGAGTATATLLVAVVAIIRTIATALRPPTTPPAIGEDPPSANLPPRNPGQGPRPPTSRRLQCTTRLSGPSRQASG